ncbi:hypothetical protein C9374_011130 [Naegleria lovaniensis]|uniref:Transposase putative helix-turn-helix domain-containing protein n=1 Tax=Naegleria lovaniensis TaxID=51637 RepID=A0AA88GCL9_NAELO|nr:uncharacterized protein C9374_011130 [Naegleria lovaniensis]KAG2374051.1 hypothetical protein C9374_011130 [Naegleria lovaniensis]
MKIRIRFVGYNNKGCTDRWFNFSQFTVIESKPVFDVPLNVHHSITENVAFDNSKKPPQLKKAKKNQKVAQKFQADKSLKIRLYPNEQERTTLNQWMGTARWIYNRCLEFTNKSKGVKKNKKNFRTFVVNNDNYQTENQWVVNTPYDVRDAAAIELLFNINFEKKKAGTIDKFMIHFRRKKDRKDHFILHCKHWKSKKGQYSFIRNIKSAEPLPKELQYNSVIIKNKLNHYYLCIPQVLDIRGENQAPQHSGQVEALDP